MTSRARVHRLPLLVRFGALSALLIAALGLVTSLWLGAEIEQHDVATTENITASALDFIATQDFQTLISSGLQISPAALNTLQTSVDKLVSAGQLVGLDAWLPPGTLRFSDDHAVVGLTRPASPLLQQAFSGKIASDVLSSPTGANAHAQQLLRRYGSLIEIFIPIQLRLPGLTFVPVVQAYLPYAPVAAQVARATRSMALLLSAGLLILYLGLFRLMATASRRLRRQAARNEELALHDGLTGLPNRTLLADRAGQAIAGSRRSGCHVGLMLLDLDRFKEINDSLGHHHGDLLLGQVGPRLRNALRDSDTVARLGGDEFAVLIPDLGHPEAALAVADKLIAVFDEPFLVDGVSLDVDLSIGVAVSPDHGDSFPTLLQHADVAMYQAKGSHTGAVIYDPSLDGHTPARLAILGELRRAIDDPEQIQLHYQPKADTSTHTIIGVEALARWNHPLHGMLPPLEFIPAAERTGLIKPLTLRVLELALGQLRSWLDDGLQISVAVNISTRNLLDLHFPSEVTQLLTRHRIPAGLLELEVTESAVVSDPERALRVLTCLAEIGVRLSIDDFGTGYSSMAYLKKLPIHTIKIDRSFVADMAHSPADAAIVRSSIDLARNLNLEVIAEGVETELVWQQLDMLGCTTVQGYYLSRPLPAAEFRNWIDCRLIHSP